MAHAYGYIAYLIDDLRAARNRLLRRLDPVTEAQAAFRPHDAAWSVAQNVEHLVWVERSGVHAMAVAMAAHRKGDPVWTGENPHRGKSIEQIVAETWREREEAPAIARPTWGGPLGYWLAALGACDEVTRRVADDVWSDELDEVIYPHEISGPLTLRQRFAFLRLHLERHEGQIEARLAHPDLPDGDDPGA